MHPLITDLSNLKNAEIETNINNLTKKYFMTSNYSVQCQISNMLDSYKEELQTRQQAEWQKVMDSRDKGLDKLINIS
jgi:hypothetical protein